MYIYFLLLALNLYTATWNVFLQENAGEYIIVKGDASACELNIAYLSSWLHEVQDTDARLFVIVRLGDGETSRNLVHRRMFNIKAYINGRVKPEKVIFAEGGRVKGEGRVEFYVGSKLKQVSLLRRGGDLCVCCCEGCERYYGWGKRRKEGKVSGSAQPNNRMHPTRNKLGCRLQERMLD